MRRFVPALVFALLTPLGGCSAPLAASSSTALDATAFVGSWEARVPGAGADAPVTHVRVWDASRRDRPLLPVFDGRPGRLGIDVVPVQADARPSAFEGEVIVSGGRRYLSAQETDTGAALGLDAFSSPLQVTVRLERAGEDVVLLAHPTQLVWSPVAVAAQDPRLDTEAIGGEGRWLVASLDDALRYYDERPDEEWRTIAVLTPLPE